MKAYVYWLYLSKHNNLLNQGYIGVSRNPEKRLKDHHYLIQNHWHENPHLLRAFEKNKNEVVQTILLIGEEKYCYEIETKLRPNKQIGWNIAEGGNKPPTMYGHTHNKGRIPTSETLEKRRESMIKKMAEKFPPENRRKRLKFGSQEYKDNMAKIVSERWKDPEYKKRTGESISKVQIGKPKTGKAAKGHHKSEETRKKQSIEIKKALAAKRKFNNG